MRIGLGSIAGQKNGKTLAPNWRGQLVEKGGLVWQCVSDLVRHYVAIAGRLLVVLDDTTYGRQGLTTFLNQSTRLPGKTENAPSHIGATGR